MPLTGQPGPAWRPLRAVAMLAAISSILWEFAAGTPRGDGYGAVVAYRILAGSIAALIGLASSSRRSARTLSWLALLLGLDLALTTCGVARHPGRRALRPLVVALADRIRHHHRGGGRRDVFHHPRHRAAGIAIR
jgi:hypothetical protein